GRDGRLTIEQARRVVPLSAPAAIQAAEQAVPAAHEQSSPMQPLSVQSSPALQAPAMAEIPAVAEVAPVSVATEMLLGSPREQVFNQVFEIAKGLLPEATHDAVYVAVDAAIANCGVVALNQYGVNVATEVAVDLLKKIIGEEMQQYENGIDNRMAATSEIGGQQALVQVGEIRNLGDFAIGEFRQFERGYRIEETIFADDGKMILLENRTDRQAGHMQTVGSVGEVDEFISRYGEPLVLMPQGQMELYKDTITMLESSPIWAGIEKMLSKSVYANMGPEELLKAVGYMLLVRKDCASILDGIGLGVDFDFDSVDAVSKIEEAYLKKTSILLDAVSKGILNAYEFDAEADLLIAERNTLMAIATGTRENRAKIMSILDAENEISDASDVAVLTNFAKTQMKVRGNIFVRGLAEYMEVTSEEKSEVDLRTALSNLKDAVEKKQTVRENFKNFFSGSNKSIIDEALPLFDNNSGGRKNRGIVMSPLMAKAVAQAA
ncbi:MAG: hypothetical protein FWH43_08700, partial [Endomicrobia bacterium]|nr:hypothetical protein [Endomicrobiia bacterium]